MKDEKKIYSKFFEFEERAASIYLQLASHFSTKPQLSALWMEMGLQEKQHAGLLQICLDENLFAENLPDAVEIEKVDEFIRSLETRAADPHLSIDEAFQVVTDLETSEVNNIYCHLTTSVHGSMYLLRRKIATLCPDQMGSLAEAARNLGASAEVLKRLDLLRQGCADQASPVSLPRKASATRPSL